MVIAENGDGITPGPQGYVQCLLNPSEVNIMTAKKLRQQTVVVKFDSEGHL